MSFWKYYKSCVFFVLLEFITRCEKDHAKTWEGGQVTGSNLRIHILKM